MRTIIACREVVDTNHWLSSPKRAEVLTAYGASNIRTFVNSQNPKKVAVLMDVADLDALSAAMANPPEDLAGAMQYDRVLPETRANRQLGE